ncbi:MAG: hypothetical protein F4065_07425 [Rhodothermaceae bacterium]|nr:hypothetical protein [Bacteroidota bacterium]MXW13297.1 hypothetical protein [Rhodothermaceae bacterium]MDE2645933.1 hypothetical protein [Bacteroidota bacterium]MXX96953.1 hypothetical protein [Rhodothermaceae bacterium]MXZ58714.1 hypothetical protein [Rhodothermaceae bacterium]
MMNDTAWIIAIVSILSLLITFVVVAITVGTKIFHVSRWSGSVDTKLSHLEEFMKKLDRKFDRIRDQLPAPNVMVGRSPLRLTEFGNDISKKIDGVNWASRIAETLTDHIQGKEAYDIQEYSFDYVLNKIKLSEEQLSLIRNVAYKKGIPEKGVRQVLGIELRDKLLDIMELEVP